MRKMTVKKLAALLCAAVLTASLAACQEDPEGSIVANKDMDKLIEEGAASDGSRVDAGELIKDAGKTEAYKTTIESQNLEVKAEVDAQVELPEAEKLSIYRVRQKPFTQEFLDKARAELCGDVELYDGEATRVRTKKDIEWEIQSWRQAVAEHEAHSEEMKNDPNIPEGEGFTAEEIEEQNKAYREEAQREIDRLQEEYEAAPAEINYAGYPTDGKLHSVMELSGSKPDSEYYTWMKDLSIDGDQCFYGISDGSDGFYRTLYVQNNADYSNQLIYRKDMEEHAHFGIIVEDTIFDTNTLNPRLPGTGTSYEEFFRAHGVPGNVLPDGTVFDSEDIAFTPLGSTTVDMPEEEAESLAQGLLDKLGLTGFALEQGGLYTEMDGLNYRVNYIFSYRREEGGVMLTQSSGGKFQYGNSSPDGGFNKQLWPGECIEVRVDDSGITGFRYNAPLEITETVVEGTSLKTFDEVKGIFEQMLPIVLAESDYECKAKVDRVRLSYSRISEKDSFDTGLIVPVWSFEGRATAYSEGYPVYEQSGTLLAVNAIDGSVIDADLGY